MKSQRVTTEMKDIMFPVVLFVMLHKMVPTFQSVDEILV